MRHGSFAKFLRRCFLAVGIVLALSMCSAVFAADDAKSGDAKSPDAAVVKPTDEKSEAPKHAAGHAVDPAIEFKPLHIVATLAQANEPVAEIKFKVRYYWKNKTYNVYYTTDEKGMIDAEIPLHKNIYSVSLEAYPDRIVPVYYSWDNRSGGSISPPAELKIKLEPGVTVGGIVRNEKGEPIKNAKVVLQCPANNYGDGSNLHFYLATLTTDDEGRWKFDGAPDDMSNFSVGVSHPDYLQGYVEANSGLRDQSSVAVLKEGLKIAGRVTDETDQPIAGASVALGADRFGSRDPKTKTDEDGNFILKNCDEGQSAITVMAKGYSPEVQSMTVAVGAPAFNFKLKPGHAFHGRVVDKSGKPLKGVTLAVDTWRGMRSLEYRATTDAEGRFSWDSAPPDEMLCDILLNGYMAIRNKPMSAQEADHEIVLLPVANISGKVTDAAGKPIMQFRVIPGASIKVKQRPIGSANGPRILPTANSKFVLVSRKTKRCCLWKPTGIATARRTAFRSAMAIVRSNSSSNRAPMPSKASSPMPPANRSRAATWPCSAWGKARTCKMAC